MITTIQIGPTVHMAVVDDIQDISHAVKSEMSLFTSIRVEMVMVGIFEGCSSTFDRKSVHFTYLHLQLFWFNLI